MMKFLFVIFAILFTSVPIAHALPKDAELVLDEIGISPSYPKHGELVALTASVYNNGIKNTGTFASIVTVGYYVDGNLLFVDTLPDLKPGLSNKLEISSDHVWPAKPGVHEMKIVVDFHNTLKDELDSPVDNIIVKDFLITPRSETTLNVTSSAQHLVQGKPVPQITVSLFDSASNQPLERKKIILYLNDDFSTLVTNEHGSSSILPIIPLSDVVNVEVYFDGDEQYLPSQSTLTLFPSSSTISQGLISDSAGIPSWIKNNAGWWADGLIDDSSFILGMQHLIENNIVQIPYDDSTDTEPSEDHVPSWIKNNAGWWADGLIDDSSFILGMQHLIANGHVTIKNS